MTSLITSAYRELGPINPYEKILDTSDLMEIISCCTCNWLHHFQPETIGRGHTMLWQADVAI